ncbi:RIO1 family-domain-containing protein [Syncephalis fuscata]|nr:RIO1 family-domain-containing protein [Syncephalis fuscata]
MRQLVTTAGNTSDKSNDTLNGQSSNAASKTTSIIVKGQAVRAMALSAKKQNTVNTKQITTSTTHTSNDHSIESQLASLSKYAHRIHLDEFGSGSNGSGNVKGISASVASDIKLSSKKAQGDRHRTTDKADRATVEQVLDPRTRIILFKLLNRNIIYEINGCISTGKEANVYHATTENGQHRAIKVYKTSILTFKDRDRYVTGEFRFRHGYNKHNPRKMVKVWAEKEMRNLKRLHQAGIPCPEPILLRQHVLLMEFLGDQDGWAYPRLKDAVIASSRYPELYRQLVKAMRTLYQVCRLVHADLSEYNILYHSRTLYIIDVSQSVEHDHPHAMDFLRKDCQNANDYFRRHDVQVMKLSELFEFITGTTFGSDDDAVEQELDRIEQMIRDRPLSQAADDQVDEAVFQQSYLPRTLDEVVDVERDVNRVHRGEADQLIYHKLTGLTTKNTTTTTATNATDKVYSKEKHKDTFEATTASVVISALQPTLPNQAATLSTAVEAEESKKKGVRFDIDNTVQVEVEKEKEKEDDEEELDSEDSEELDSDSDLDSEYDSEMDSDEDSSSERWRRRKEKPLRGKRHESAESRKERKQQSKEAARERRKTKMPKAVKKRREKLTAKGKGKKK